MQTSLAARSFDAWEFYATISVVGIPRDWTIAEAGNRILDPFTPLKLDQLGGALRMVRGASMLDLACGKGEALCQWARAYGITGLGVDVHPPFVAAARERAQEFGVSAQLDFLEADASGYIADAPVDIAACMGGSWIAGGPLGTADLLARSLKPGGIALIGEPFWREVPTTDEAITGSGTDNPDDFSTLWGLIEAFQSAGWDLVEMVLSDEDSWDRYVATQWLSIRRFIDANPEDELVPELRARLDEEPRRYARYQGRHLGWGVFALMER